jgi:hypothetical protein
MLMGGSERSTPEHHGKEKKVTGNYVALLYHMQTAVLKTKGCYIATYPFNK